MKIVTVPHPSLRQTAEEITKVDKKLLNFIEQLQETLNKKRNPGGVGLAAPQVDASRRVFATKLPSNQQHLPPEARRINTQLRYFINPVIIQHGNQHLLGVDPDDPDLEGCLSIPTLYGPVPRWDWIEIEYQQIEDNQLTDKTERFADFHARVVQHEIDHLDGILFTDYSLEYGLPIYRADKNDQLIEIDPKLVEIF